MATTKKNPRFAGVGLRKLASWAQVNATTIGNVLLLAVLLAAVLWQGVAQ